MNIREVQDLYAQYVLPTYSQVPLCLVRGRGSRVWDLGAKEYLDFFPGWAVSGLGHCHPEVVNAVKDQARKILHIPNNFLNLKQAQLAREISGASFPSRVFFCNSGAEATDSAVKFARKYGHDSGLRRADRQDLPSVPELLGSGIGKISFVIPERFSRGSPIKTFGDDRFIR